MNTNTINVFIGEDVATHRLVHLKKDVKPEFFIDGHKDEDDRIESSEEIFCDTCKAKFLGQKETNYEEEEDGFSIIFDDEMPGPEHPVRRKLWLQNEGLVECRHQIWDGNGQCMECAFEGDEDENNIDSDGFLKLEEDHEFIAISAKNEEGNEDDIDLDNIDLDEGDEDQFLEGHQLQVDFLNDINTDLEHRNIELLKKNEDLVVDLHQAFGKINRLKRKLHQARGEISNYERLEEVRKRPQVKRKRIQANRKRPQAEREQLDGITEIERNSRSPAPGYGKTTRDAFKTMWNKGEMLSKRRKNKELFL